MTLEQRIAAIEDREAIADLVLAHAEHIRAGTVEQTRDLFSPCAVYELAHRSPSGAVTITDRIEGVDAILGSKDEVAGHGVQLCPMIHNLRIAVDGDTATSSCVSMTTVWPMGNNFIGEYRDRFAKADGRWRFVYRMFLGFGSIDGATPEEVHQKYQAGKQERAALASR